MDISCVILAGSRLAALHATIRAAHRAVARLEKEGGTAEVILVTSTDDAAVAEQANAAAGGTLKIVVWDNDDPVNRWREAAARTDGQLLSFVEAGDMWSSNWLASGLHATRRERTRRSVWRPEMVLGSGSSYFAPHDLHAHLQPYLATASDEAALMLAELYAPACLLHRDVLDRVQPPQPDSGRGWGDSRTWWTANALAAGFAQRLVEGTILYRWDRPPTAAAPVRFGPTPLAEPADEEARPT